MGSVTMSQTASRRVAVNVMLSPSSAAGRDRVTEPSAIVSAVARSTVSCVALTRQGRLQCGDKWVLPARMLSVAVSDNESACVQKSVMEGSPSRV